MTERLENLQEYVDHLQDGKLRPALYFVVSWVVYPQRVETVARRDRALALLDKLNVDGDLAYPEIKKFLHSLCGQYPELIEGMRAELA